MDPDLFFVIGVIICVLAVPAIFGALVEGRAPRAAAIVVMIGGGLVALAVSEKPGGYALASVPDVFVRVIGQLMN
ncbi:MAG: hypothetical protein JKX69_04800 [Rhodobacteraceae bacterium]|nr:hypothetical protein [Paracoccaceae bacterium]